MKHMKHFVAGLFAVLLVMTAFVVLAPGARAQARVGAFVETISWFEQPNQAQALSDLTAGTMDIYMFNLRTAADIAAAKANPDLKTLDSVGSLNDLFLNAIPNNQTIPGFNPFTIRQVREAMNFVVDR